MSLASKILFALSGAALSLPVQAQPVSGSVDQIARGPEEPIEQISNGSRQIISPVQTEAQAQQSAPQQLSSGRESNAPTAQLTSEPRTARGPAQLYTGSRTAEPSEALSRPSDGRTGAVAPVGGRDRCDPETTERDEHRARLCAAVIETRASEFARPDPAELSPEQRILVEQRSRNAQTSSDATRKLGEGNFDPDSPDAQGIASVALRNTVPPTGSAEPAAPAEALSEAAQALIEAIVTGVTGQAIPPQ